MNNIIGYDVFKFRIETLLYPIDLYHLWICCKSFVQYINLKDIKRNAAIQIEKEMSLVLGIHYDKFKILFDEWNGFISGSIITKSIVSKNLTRNDTLICILVDNYMCDHSNIWVKFAKDRLIELALLSRRFVPNCC